MSISHYSKTTPFLSDLNGASLDQLRGKDTRALADLQQTLGRLNIRVTHDGTPLTQEQMTKVLAYLLPPQAQVANGWYASQTQSGLEAVKKTLAAYAKAHPATPWPLSDFLALTHADLTSDTLDDDVIDVYVAVMEQQDAKRLTLRDELTSLTGELSIYSVVQAQINARLSSKSAINIEDTSATTGLNLLDKTLYGYSEDSRWLKSAEYTLLTGMDTGKGKTRISIKDFLSGVPKESGAIKAVDLKRDYPFEKDNNPVANLATTVGDRARPLNDKVSEKTTLLNDVSSRYNAAIEALNRFVQKHDSLLRDILNAI